MRFHLETQPIVFQDFIESLQRYNNSREVKLPISGGNIPVREFSGSQTRRDYKSCMMRFQLVTQPNAFQETYKDVNPEEKIGC